MNYPNVSERFMFEVEESPGKWIGPTWKFKTVAEARASCEATYQGWYDMAAKRARIIKVTTTKEVYEPT
jgi:hypothetical protein